MLNRRLSRVFREVFELSNEEIETAEYLNTPKWDSLQHVALILELEEEFS